MTEFKLNVPKDNVRVTEVRVSDVLYVTGDIAVARDQAHKKLLETFVPELAGLPIFHCGPIARKDGEKWEIVAGGPTTSTRMDAHAPGPREVWDKDNHRQRRLGGNREEGPRQFWCGILGVHGWRLRTSRVEDCSREEEASRRARAYRTCLDLGSERFRTTSSDTGSPRWRYQESRYDASDLEA